MKINELMDDVSKLVTLKRKRQNINKQRVEHYQKYKKLLGEEQQLTRDINKAIDNFERFKITDKND